MNAEQKESLRHAVMEFLAARHPAAFIPRAIRRKVADEVDFQITEEDIAATCEFLIGMEAARELPDALGSTRYYSGTAAGVLAWERGFKPPPPRPD